MLGFSNYNYRRFTYDLFRQPESEGFTGPRAGEEAPDFRSRTLSRESVRLSDYRGKKNVLLVFGSATCPMTANSIQGIQRLYERVRGDEIEFLFVYVREAHPGERIPAHDSMADKLEAATRFRDEEELFLPMIIDDLRGTIHRKYSNLPNPAFLIDRSGRLAFRCSWTNAAALDKAVTELLERQRQRGEDLIVVCGGQDLSMPLSYSSLLSYRALERGGSQSVADFREALGQAGGAAISPSRVSEPLFGHPGRVLAIVALTSAVLAGGLYAGFELRKRRLGSRRNPYRAYENEEVKDTDTGTDYGAVGI
ncbi:MAG TPA: redoxin domain-containing protein [Candidatus Angelobacter sp.]|nr:redoxin domain-containing protein [Candidatus Angelobacter sp.]